MNDRQFFIVSWGPVGSASTSGFACPGESSIVGKLHRSSLSNLEWERPLRGSSFASGGLDVVLLSLGGAWISGLSHLMVESMCGFFGSASKLKSWMAVCSCHTSARCCQVSWKAIRPSRVSPWLGGVSSVCDRCWFVRSSHLWGARRCSSWIAGIESVSPVRER